MKYRYRKTTDPKKMMTNAQFDDALQNDYENLVKDVGYGLYRTSTYISYKAGTTKALVWNEGETEKTEIDLPLENDRYLVNNKYGIPNEKKSEYNNPNTRYLWRKRNEDYSGSVARVVGYCGRRLVDAYVGWSYDSGVEKIEETEQGDQAIEKQITIIQEYKTILQQAYQLISCENRGKTGTKLCTCEGCEVKREILKLVGEKYG